MTAAVEQTKSFLLRWLDPADALCEITCGLVMVLTISLTAGWYVGDSSDPGQTLLVAVIGCNLAWGFIDGALYVLSSVYERAQQNRIVRMVQRAKDPARAEARIRDGFADAYGELLPADRIDELAKVVHEAALDVRVEQAHPVADDWKGGAVSMLLNILATLPAAIPLVLIDDWQRALRVSNLLVLCMLFAVGYAWARQVDASPWKTGSVMVAFGGVMVAVAVALGG